MEVEVVFWRQRCGMSWGGIRSGVFEFITFFAVAKVKTARVLHLASQVGDITVFKISKRYRSACWGKGGLLGSHYVRKSCQFHNYQKLLLASPFPNSKFPALLYLLSMTTMREPGGSSKNQNTEPGLSFHMIQH